jgi:hypothetical protein
MLADSYGAGKKKNKQKIFLYEECKPTKEKDQIIVLILTLFLGLQEESPKFRRFLS